MTKAKHKKKKTYQPQTVREVALEALERIEHGGAYSNLLLHELSKQAKLNEQDNRLLTELVYGTLSRKLRLAYDLSPFVKHAKTLDRWVELLLMLSIYQLVALDKIPAHAVFYEAVDIAKKRGNPGIGKFVNGVLRAFQRQGAPALADISDPLTRLSVEISLPKWLTQLFIQQIGESQTKALGLSLLEKSKASARVDTRQITRTQALQFLQTEGIQAVASRLSPVGIVAEKGFLAGSELFQAGKLTIQDESSMLVAPTMRLEKHMQVLDACAAPGGKTLHMATFLEKAAGGSITALDIHDHKLALIEANAKRMHVSELVHAQKLDAREAGNHFPPNTFDRILVDAPCSGLGLMRRKPDIKYNKTREDLQKLPKIQLEILESVAKTLKQWGIIVYSTCTVNQEENQQVVQSFLEKHPNFQKIDVCVNEIAQTAIQDQMFTLYPQQFHTDGFFICCMQKVC